MRDKPLVCSTTAQLSVEYALRTRFDFVSRSNDLFRALKGKSEMEPITAAILDAVSSGVVKSGILNIVIHGPRGI